ncbi:hypothetical protein GY45DRAFT_766862 [Cubamyces sp. BRFM 1775]|nr:hypothetical protein GY45DRAFT_766862 [Cubamyces sp. BRFM 1775]
MRSRHAAVCGTLGCLAQGWTLRTSTDIVYTYNCEFCLFIILNGLLSEREKFCPVRPYDMYEARQWTMPSRTPQYGITIITPTTIVPTSNEPPMTIRHTPCLPATHHTDHFISALTIDSNINRPGPRRLDPRGTRSRKKTAFTTHPTITYHPDPESGRGWSAAKRNGTYVRSARFDSAYGIRMSSSARLHAICVHETLPARGCVDATRWRPCPSTEEAQRTRTRSAYVLLGCLVPSKCMHITYPDRATDMERSKFEVRGRSLLRSADARVLQTWAVAVGPLSDPDVRRRRRRRCRVSTTTSTSPAAARARGSRA